MGNLTNPATPMPQFGDHDTPLEPTQLRQGDSWNWMRYFPDYSSGMYTLSYILNSANNRFTFPPDGITPDDAGQGFVIQLSAAKTTACAPDMYQIVAVLTGIAGTTAEGEQVTLPLQDVCVAPNLATAQGPVDTRSNAKRNLDAIEACLLGNADPSVEEYTINGRMLRRFNRAELIKEREYWRNEYKVELKAAGLYTETRTITFRFKG